MTDAQTAIQENTYTLYMTTKRKKKKKKKKKKKTPFRYLKISLVKEIKNTKKTNITRTL